MNSSSLVALLQRKAAAARRSGQDWAEQTQFLEE